MRARDDASASASADVDVDVDDVVDADCIINLMMGLTVALSS